MNLQLFNKVTIWQDATFPNANAYAKVKHLESEVKELLDAIANKEPIEDVKSEIADCILLIFGAAAKLGLSYENICMAIERKHEINILRKWGEPDENGVVNHIK